MEIREAIARLGVLTAAARNARELQLPASAMFRTPVQRVAQKVLNTLSGEVSGNLMEDDLGHLRYELLSQAVQAMSTAYLLGIDLEGEIQQLLDLMELGLVEAS